MLIVLLATHIVDFVSDIVSNEGWKLLTNFLDTTPSNQIIHIYSTRLSDSEFNQQWAEYRQKLALKYGMLARVAIRVVFINSKQHFVLDTCQQYRGEKRKFSIHS